MVARQGSSATQEQWTAVDCYITNHLVPSDYTLESAIESSAAAGLPPHNVSPNQGKLLHLLALIQKAKTILEIGTLGGYSTIWLARALPADGRLITLEADPKHAEIAKANLTMAGLSHIVDLRLGLALDTLPQLQAEGHTFDLIFIDADKPNNPGYLAWAITLSHVGSLIIADNVVRNGTILDPKSADASTRGVQRFYEMLAAEPRVTATAIQTVGSKGYDGFAMALVTADP